MILKWNSDRPDICIVKQVKFKNNEFHWIIGAGLEQVCDGVKDVCEY